MKAIKTILTAACLLVAGIAFAQKSDAPKKERQYHVHLVKEDNGNTEVIDQYFKTKEEMEAYLKDNAAEISELPPLPDVPEPPQPPLPPSKPLHMKSCGNDSAMSKRIIIVEKEKVVGDKDDNMQLDVQLQEDKDDARWTQKAEAGNEGADAEVIIIKRGPVAKGGEAGKKETVIVPSVANEQPSNISELGFYPNPNNGQFHVSFNVKEPTDVVLNITDMNGKLVYSDSANNFSGSYQKDFYQGKLQAGTYLMEVKAGTEKQALKVVVQ